MRLYLDDDSVDPGLIRLLRRDGHDVQVPADVGLVGSSDQVHLAHAIRDRRAILTRNCKDFQALHDLVVSAASGHHCGILYDELRKLAAQKLAQEKPGQTLQATTVDCVGAAGMQEQS